MLAMGIQIEWQNAHADVQPTLSTAPSCVTCCGGSVRRIAFICDTSESMRAKWPTLLEKLGGAISGLRPIQTFDIVLIRPGSPLIYSLSMATANAREKRLALAFLNQAEIGGETTPTAGLDLAMSRRPNLVYLLIDASFSANEARARLCEINADPHVRVNVIILTDSQDADAEKIEELKGIAEENGGTSKTVVVDENAPGLRR